jgi:hypothetical protein
MVLCQLIFLNHTTGATVGTGHYPSCQTLRFLENFLGRHTGVALPFHHLSALFVQQLGEWKTTPGFERCVCEVGVLSDGDRPQPAFGYGFAGLHQ